MTCSNPTPHRATPEQWAQCEADAARWPGATAFHCLLELRDRLQSAEQRISELESASEPQITPEEAEMIAAPWSLITPEPQTAAPAGSLVEVVVEEICHITGNHVDDDVARGVILACAGWLDSVGNNGSARELREEVER